MADGSVYPKNETQIFYPKNETQIFECLSALRYAGKRLLAHMLVAMIKTHRKRRLMMEAFSVWRHREQTVRKDGCRAVNILHRLRKQLVAQQLWAVMTFWRRYTMHKRSERLGVRAPPCAHVWFYSAL
jgi:hypothetical protein